MSRSNVGSRVKGAGMNRRDLLKVSALAGGGLLLQTTLIVSADEAAPGPLVRSKELNVFVQIDPDGQITIVSSIPEMGQGIKTALPMIIAEEMGARWEDVKVVEAPLDAAKYGMQGAGGSTSIPRNYAAMRKMGASAREMLIGAAALQMEVEREDLEARDSTVVHSSGVQRTFGQLATLAAEQPVPDPEMLSYKDPRSYTIIGTAISGVDNLVIATGLTEFGIDVDVPGMKYASYQRCPRIGGVAKSFNAKEIKALPGIVDAFVVEPNLAAGNSQMGFLSGAGQLRGGIAIVADDTWSAMAARQKLTVEWDETTASRDDWDEQVAWAKKTAKEGGGEVKVEGKGVDAALADPANQTLTAFYQFPYVAHVCMEPMNCTADYKKGANGAPDQLEVWLGSQFPGQIKERVISLASSLSR